MCMNIRILTAYVLALSNRYTKEDKKLKDELFYYIIKIIEGKDKDVY